MRDGSDAAAPLAGSAVQRVSGAPSLDDPVELVVLSETAIPLQVGAVTPSQLAACASRVNHALHETRDEHLGELDVFDIIDLRMLSGLVGEMFTAAFADSDGRFIKNPNLDGYPDLCDISSCGSEISPMDFLSFPDGGIEVKNTFGVKRARAVLRPRSTRRGQIQSRLVWKAHHQTTNNLLALQSDYINEVPQIVAGYFCGTLTPADWTVRSEPKEGSTMTSFCQTTPAGWAKLAAGVVFADERYW